MRRITIARRLLAVKETVGWIAVVLGDAFHGSWFDWKTSDKDWEKYMMPLFERTAEHIYQTALALLTARLTKTSVAGLLRRHEGDEKDARDEHFLAWFRDLGEDHEARHTGTLHAVLLVAARIMDYGGSSSEGKYILREMMASLESFGSVWPKTGVAALKMNEQFRADLFIQESMAAVFPLICLSLENIIAAVIPVEFKGMVWRVCGNAQCQAEWKSETLSLSTIVVNDMPLQESIMRLGVCLILVFADD
jgi:hypothetical protein